jgi:NTP pyrophosphatase (non-canonical NTP hydrolase)
MSESPTTDLTLAEFQRMILQMYGAKDAARGDAATFLWLTEEFGELATAVRAGDPEELAAEMADVLAWLATLANIRGVDLGAAVVRKYGSGCPGCQRSPCECDPAEKP